MPSGWAYTPGGVDAFGHYADGVVAWAQVTPYFKARLLQRITFSVGFIGAAQLYVGSNTAINARFGSVYGVGGGYTEYDSFALKSSAMGDGNLYGDTTGGYNLGRTIRHELGHAVDFVYSYPAAGAATTDPVLVAKHNDDIRPSLIFGSLPINGYADNSVYEWFAEFFTEMMAERVLGYVGVCDGDRTTPGPNTVWAVNWFAGKFPGWSSKTAPAITSSAPAAATRGTFYNHVFTASGSTAVWSVISGALPAGVNLNSTTGGIFGTPTAAGSNTFTIGATNVAGAVTQSVNLTVQPSAAANPLFVPLAIGMRFDPFEKYPNGATAPLRPYAIALGE